jgi:hypothetical protein
VEKPTCTSGKIHLYKWVLAKHKWILEKHKWVLSKTQVDIAPHEFFYFPIILNKDSSVFLCELYSEAEPQSKFMILIMIIIYLGP